MFRFPALPLVVLLSQCGDETVRAYGAADHVWRLVELDGQPFAARATLHFPDVGRIQGRAPCNSYGADMTAPYPWFEVGPILSSRSACGDLEDERRFFDALRAATQAEVSGDTLILRDDAGREMVFKPTG